MGNKVVGIVGPVVILVLFGISISYSEQNKAAPETRTSTAPVVTEAWFSDNASTNENSPEYQSLLNVRFEPTEPPLEREYIIYYKNRNGEGVYHEKDDISEFASAGSFKNTRTFKYPGEYAFTIVLRNEAGEGTMVLPPLIVK